jgi:hypothetical protein
MRDLDKNISTQYLSLFSTTRAIRKLNKSGLFDRVDCVFELDPSFKCFFKKSRYYPATDKSEIKREFTSQFCSNYGEKHLLIPKRNRLGYKNSQLLLSFAHNTPDNTVPIFWEECENWTPLFKRYPKE